MKPIIKTNKVLGQIVLNSGIAILIIILIEFSISKVYVPFASLSLITLTLLRIAGCMIFLPPVFYFSVYRPIKKYTEQLSKDASEQKERETAFLRISEERFRTLINALSQAVYRMSPDWKTMYTLSGGNFIHSTGKENSNWFEEYIPEDTQDLVNKTIQKAIQTKSMFELEHKVILLNGGIGWTYSKALPLLNENGEITEWFGAATDITRRKKAEEALIKSEERFYKAFNNNPNPFIITRVKDYKVVNINEAFLNLLEFKKEEVVGNNLENLGIYPNPEKRKDYVSEIIKSGKVRNAEIEMRTKSGKPLYVLVYAQVIDISGETNVLTNLTDITERKKTEQELKESEERYRNLLYELNEGFCLVEVIFDENNTPSDLRFLEVNPEYEIQTGVSDAAGKLRSEIGRPVEQKWLEIYGRIAKTGIPEHFEMEAKTLNRSYEVHGYRVRRSNNVAILFNDITERKKAEEALIESEERFSKAFYNGPFAAALVRLSDNRNIEVNTKFLEMFEFKREQVINNTSKELNIFKNYNNRGELLDIVEREGHASNYEIEMLTGSGRTLNVLVSVEKILLMGEKHIYANYIDITELKKVQEELRKSEQRWITTLRSLNEAVISTDPAGNVNFINPEAECLTGWAKEEVMNRPVREFYHIIDEYTRENLEDPVQKILAQGIRYREKNHTLLIRKQGEELPIEESGAPIKDENNTVDGTVLIFHDVTEQKIYERKLKEYSSTLEEKVEQRTSELKLALEQAKSADRMKTSFLLTMSHELRTPLNSIIGFSGILNQEIAGSLNEEQKKQITMIQQSGRHLLRLINDVLDLSKIEVGELIVHFESINVNQVIDQVIEAEKPMAEGKGLILSLNKPKEEIIAESDASRFHQVILNLVHNAIKFTDEGFVNVKYWSEKDNLYVEVSDSGIGIREEKMNQLFVSFAKIDDDVLIRRHKGTGSGLGLAISRRIMELLHGSITAESKYGEGSTFTVVLPLNSRTSDEL